LIPEEIVTSGMHWRYLQSFTYHEEIFEGGVPLRRERQSKYHDLPAKVQAELTHFEHPNKYTSNDEKSIILLSPP